MQAAPPQATLTYLQAVSIPRLRGVFFPSLAIESPSPLHDLDELSIHIPDKYALFD